MNIWPFWRFWYFAKEQRLAIVLMSIFILVLILLNKPISEYFSKKKEKQLAIETQKEWERISESIKLSKNLALEEKQNKSKYAIPYETNKTSSSIQSKNKQQIIEINTANINEWKSLDGIGEVLSSRIIKFKEKLGGFHSVNQIREVYGVNDSLFGIIKPRIRCNSSLIKKLNPNTADFDELKQHPYISPTLAKQMVGYRQKVKPYEQVEDIKSLYSMNDTIFSKLSPYISIK